MRRNGKQLQVILCFGVPSNGNSFKKCKNRKEIEGMKPVLNIIEQQWSNDFSN